MSAHIVLDQSHTTFTNLDVISGRLYIRAPRKLTVSTINVKLEGESRTRLMPPAALDDRRPTAQLEFHKVILFAHQFGQDLVTSIGGMFLDLQADLGRSSIKYRRCSHLQSFRMSERGRIPCSIRSLLVHMSTLSDSRY